MQAGEEEHHVVEAHASRRCIDLHDHACLSGTAAGSRCCLQCTCLDVESVLISTSADRARTAAMLALTSVQRFCSCSMSGLDAGSCCTASL